MRLGVQLVKCPRPRGIQPCGRACWVRLVRCGGALQAVLKSVLKPGFPSPSHIVHTTHSPPCLMHCLVTNTRMSHCSSRSAAPWPKKKILMPKRGPQARKSTGSLGKSIPRRHRYAPHVQPVWAMRPSSLDCPGCSSSLTPGNDPQGAADRVFYESLLKQSPNR